MLIKWNIINNMQQITQNCHSVQKKGILKKSGFPP